MSDREKALEAALERVQSELSVFMRAGVSDPECPKWVEDLQSAARTALAMPATVSELNLAQAATVILAAMQRAQIDMAFLHKFLNGEPVVALNALRNLTPPEDKI